MRRNLSELGDDRVGVWKGDFGFCRSVESEMEKLDSKKKQRDDV